MARYGSFHVGTWLNCSGTTDPVCCLEKARKQQHISQAVLLLRTIRESGKCSSAVF